MVSSVLLVLLVLQHADPAAAQTSDQAKWSMALADSGHGRVTLTLSWEPGYDSNLNAAATVKYRLYPGHPFQGGQPAYTDQVITHAGGQNQVVWDLTPGRYFDFRVEVSDPDGMVGAAAQENPGVLLRDDRFRFEVAASNPHPGPQYDEAMVRDIVNGKLYWSSNQGQWEYGSAYEYTLSGALSEFAVTQGKTAWQSVSDGAGKIYLAGEMPRGDGSHHYRAMIGIVTEGANPSFVANLVPYTDDVNEFIGVALDAAGNRLIAGERGPGTPLTNSGWPRGGGLWSIPLDTINTPSSYIRIYQDPGNREWTHLMLFNGRVYAQMSDGSVISAPLSAATWGMRPADWTTEFAGGITAMIVSRDQSKLYAVSNAGVAAGDFSTIYTDNGTGWSNPVGSKACTPFGLAELPDGRLLHETWLYSNSHVDCVSDPRTGAFAYLEGGNLGASIPGVGMGGANFNYLYSGNSIFYGTVNPGKIIKASYLAPQVANVRPGGAIYSGSATVSADYADASGAGIDTGAVTVTLDGGALAGCTATTTQVSCQVNSLTPGNHVIGGQAADNTGNMSPISGSFIVANRRSLFAWYDNMGGRNWILAANPAAAGSDAWLDLYLAGGRKGLPLLANLAPGQVPPGRTIAFTYTGQRGGPLDLRYFAPGEAILSQRTHWKQSLEEVVGFDSARLTNHYWWSWYDDSVTPDMLNWVLIANTTDLPVDYQIKLAGQQLDCDADHPCPEAAPSGTIVPGEKITARFPGRRGGPLEVTASGAVIASQRVHMNFGRPEEAFNEVVGVPDGELSSHYWWTWYDDLVTPGMFNWVLIANPNSYRIDYQIKVAGELLASGSLEPLGTRDAAGDPLDIVFPRFSGLRGGPVEVLTFRSGSAEPAKAIASQRVHLGPSFGEVAGYPDAALAGDYHWSWYDDLVTPNMFNWVLIANPNNFQVDYQIKVAGVTRGGGSLEPAGARDAEGRPLDIVTPRFPGLQGGPVEVLTFLRGTATPANTIVSQRVHLGSYINEVMGVEG